MTLNHPYIKDHYALLAFSALILGLILVYSIINLWNMVKCRWELAGREKAKRNYQEAITQIWKQRKQ